MEDSISYNSGAFQMPATAPVIHTRVPTVVDIQLGEQLPDIPFKAIIKHEYRRFVDEVVVDRVIVFPACLPN